MDVIIDLGPLTACLILGLSFIGSFITAAFGIGGGIITLAGIASLLPASAIIPVHGAVQVGSNAGRAVLMFRHITTTALLPFAIGALIGAAIGGALAVELDPSILQVLLGLFILWTIFCKPPAIIAKSAGLVGVISSFLTMFVGGTGPFVITFVKSLGLDRLGIVGTNAGFMTLQHSLKTIVFALLGFAFSQWLLLILMMICAGLIGTLFGKRVLMTIDEANFKRVLNALLGVLAIRLIVVGAWSWLEGINPPS